MMDGGYDSGYAATPCFWGECPSSLVREALRRFPPINGMLVLDAGCGEGKNASAFAKLGCRVDAVDCSVIALEHGRNVFSHPTINWISEDIKDFRFKAEHYDIVLAYGLLHCMPDPSTIKSLVSRIQNSTKLNGLNIVCTFNDREQDLSAHPGFRPTLLRHNEYVEFYKTWDLIEVSDENLHETHPHNNIPHTHSMTRIMARKL